MPEDDKSSAKEDRRLVRRALGGDRKAFEMIVRKYQRRLVQYVGRMVPDREQALDASQEVFLRAYTSLASYRPEFAFATWLYRIASNYVIDVWRKKKVTAVSIDRPLDDGEDGGRGLQLADEKASVVRALEMKELRRRIEASLGRLPEHLREVFVWRHVNGLSYEEMAQVKEIPVGTVKNRVFQAKEMLRRWLEE
ncbi:MAG: sigma-70 family RNA polymerase sigma factor [Candidatus Aminicenantes bacterium]|nr:sigma-70 family RNA polymerase sigma factor [Candidatus Aminicenantes bacterium]